METKENGEEGKERERRGNRVGGKEKERKERERKEKEKGRECKGIGR